MERTAWGEVLLSRFEADGTKRWTVQRLSTKQGLSRPRERHKKSSRDFAKIRTPFAKVRDGEAGSETAVLAPPLRIPDPPVKQDRSRVGRLEQCGTAHLADNSALVGENRPRAKQFFHPRQPGGKGPAMSYSEISRLVTVGKNSGPVTASNSCRPSRRWMAGIVRKRMRCRPRCSPRRRFLSIYLLGIRGRSAVKALLYEGALDERTHSTDSETWLVKTSDSRRAGCSANQISVSNGRLQSNSEIVFGKDPQPVGSAMVRRSPIPSLQSSRRPPG